MLTNFSKTRYCKNPGSSELPGLYWIPANTKNKYQLILKKLQAEHQMSKRFNVIDYEISESCSENDRYKLIQIHLLLKETYFTPVAEDWH